MNGSLTTFAVRVACGVTCTIGPFLVAHGLAKTGEYPGRERMVQYSKYLDRTLKHLFLKRTAREIIRMQCAGILVGVFAYFGLKEHVALLFCVVAMAAPAAIFSIEKTRRRAEFDMQSDGFALALANSLKAVPSIGAALQGIMPVLVDPVRQEIAIALSELRLGSTVDQVLVNASARAESIPFDSAISALLVGRQVGGNLPKILETTAASIREMNRLAGNLRSKTAESRAQLWVLALFPFGIVFLFTRMRPGYFDPLQTSDIGHLFSGVAVLLWASALLLARKISQVNL
jgi:tight adherence protein B